MTLFPFDGALAIDVVKRLIPSRMTPSKMTEARQSKNRNGTQIQVANSNSSTFVDHRFLFTDNPLNQIQIG